MRVGVLFPLTGGTAQWGRECANGALAAVAMHPPVEAVVEDAADPGAAARLIDRDGAMLVFGTLFTALAVAASEAVVERGAAYAEVSAVADDLGERGLPRFIRTCPRAATFGRRAVDFAADELGAARVAVLYEDSAFGRSLGAAIARAARARVLDPVAEMEHAADTTDFRAALAELRRADPDVLLAASYTAFSQRLWAQLRGAELPLRAVVGVGGGWLHLGEGAAVSAEGVYAVDVAPADALADSGLVPEARALRDLYRASYRDRFGAAASVYSDLAFSGAELALGAFFAAGGDPDAFMRVARAIDVPDGGTILGYGARFDASGENERAAPMVMRHRAGGLPVVHPARFAAS